MFQPPKPTGSNTCGVLSALLLASPSLLASPLAYEGFNYAGGGTLTGQTGGSGWGAAWQTVVGGTADTVAASLQGAANTPLGFDSASAAGSVNLLNNRRVGRMLDTTVGGAFGSRGYRDANGRIGADGKTLYLSFLQQPNGNASFYEFEFHRDDLNDPGRIAGVGDDQGAATNVYLRTAGTHTLVGPGTSAVNFYVVRIDFKPGNDDVYVYQNPTSPSEPGIPTLVKLNACDMSFNGLSLAAFNNARTVAHDEIRLGETWADVVSGTARPAPIRIMPIGDSITFGSSVAGGYRNKLFQTLTAAGYTVDFVGNQTGNGASTLQDWDHEGHGGWTISQLDSNISSWVSNIADPDVILVHIGTNDFGTGFDTTHAIDRLDALITKMATLRPKAHIIVTNLMERGEPFNSQIVAQFNPFVQAKVNAQAALGRNVTFLDMRSFVPVAEMPDQLHPGQVGYDHMADAWAPAIQAVIGINGDTVPPEILRAKGAADLTHVTVTFSKPISDAAATIGNFSISGGLTVSSAVLDPAKRFVVLTTSAQTRGTSYTVTVNNIVDRTAGPLSLAPGSTVNFTGAAGLGYLNNVPEAAGYTLAYSLDIPNAANYSTSLPPYAVDNHNGLGAFSRVAYYLELQSPSGDVQYVWTSMDAFTTDAGKIGLPTFGSGAIFQQGLTGMTVVSNVPRVTTGTNLTGNIEFWPNNYDPANAANVTGAEGALTDFGDSRTTATTGGAYGSMQIHNTGAKETVFGFNNWGGSSGGGFVDLGIGTNPVSVNNATDWTFLGNGATYTVKTLQVFVRVTDDSTRPTASSANSSFGRTQVLVHFSEPLSPSSVALQNFALDNGVTILNATLSPNQRDVTLTTSLQPLATPLTLTINNVRDSSPSANVILPGTTVSVTPIALPAEVVTNVGASANNYQLVASIDIPAQGNFNASNAAYLYDDRNATGSFNRVAYYLELQKPSQAPQYVWVAMDAFTSSRKQLAFPSFSSGAFFQQNVTNMQVLSNAAGVTTGTTATGGNIEFWPDSYTEGNTILIGGSSGTTFDTGDNRTALNFPGYGCMQVHNHTTNQTVFALNHWGTDGFTLDAGIGNNPAPVNNATDWTFSASAPNYTRRILHVMVLPGSSTPANVATNVPASAGYQLAYTLNIPATGNATTLPYSFNQSADLGSFSRIAYYMELQTGAATPNYLWVSMDAFTTDPKKLAVPTAASGGFFQQNVANMNVVSNVAGIVNGTTATGGNIEFWPSGYNATNSTGVPNASAAIYDFGDDGANATAGYGSMQVHNHDLAAKQTLFAFNNFGTTTGSQSFCLGIGNNPAPTSGATDWTFANNAATYSNRVLHVFVLPNADTGPAIVDAKGSSTLNRLIVAFNKPLTDTSAVAANFSIPGLTVTGATLLAGNKDIAVTTSAQTAGTLYTVNVSGVRDRVSGTTIAGGASTTFTAVTTPAVFANVPEISGYKLAYKVALPTASPQWNFKAIPYSVDESRYGDQPFDRVAYLMELNGTFSYASFDRHTAQISKIGIPTLSVAPTPFQQNVTNMTVVSNVAGVVNTSTVSGGNIEFWGGDYTGVNALAVPGASASGFDFGDTMTTGGHGCLQIHNHDLGALQTVMGFSNWGSNTGTTSEGIGNRPSSANTDWTAADNGASYTTKNLYVLIRPSGTSAAIAPIVASHPQSRMINPGANASFSVTAGGSGPFTYQWRHNGTPISGQTNPWLDITGATSGDLGSYDVVVTGASTNLSATSLAAQLTFTPPYDLYLSSFPSLSGGALLRGADPDGDGFNNLGEFAFGTDPSSAAGGALAYTGAVLTKHGSPIVIQNGPDFRAVFARRKDYLTAGLTYTVQFSAKLDLWTNSSDIPTVEASDTTMDAVSVPYPALVPVTGDVPQKPLFFRVRISE